MISCPLRNYFAISFPSAPIDVPRCWQLLSDYLESHNALPSKFSLSQLTGHAEGQRSEQDLVVTASEAANIITARKLTGFSVDTGYTDISVSYTLQHNSLNCRIGNNAKAPMEWKPFIKTVVSEYETIGAWEVFWPYRTWQDLRHPSSFDNGAWGPFPPGYRVRHEPDVAGIGPGQTLFDKSLNPGHTKVVEHRTIFYPTAEMWLGPHFWQYAKCTKEEALTADFFIEKMDTPNYLYLKCWPTAFTRPDGEQGRMQQRLWKLFFHEDCEWPPGSGTICDEPMYGPPELMPRNH
ncbi:hypothetical protein JIN84_00330 [Luteolibacter yonseiensis]|uniref:Uncharacterized protein n=1 Tax=Luteolibacter yonseiensis TaxID=1144680 RepID=A0A934QWK8_9BACT|nr:hypothetical protein [Luteolibacter yonseiensis]MBK1814053.1 hypothetical protein [Luteolibacter yonseiensis]